MPHPQFDRHAVHFKPLADREDRVFIAKQHVSPDAECRALEPAGQAIIDETADRMRRARDAGKARMLAFGAHTIKNGLAPVLIRFIEDGWFSHLATNGAGIIHDWEFAFQGHSSEDVEKNVAAGQFGIWHETGFYLNLALVLGAFNGLGYGESIGAMVEQEGLELPEPDALRAEIRGDIDKHLLDRAAAAADLLWAMETFDINPGWMKIPHPHKQFGLQAAAHRLGVPFTGHPMFGHDIIYTHPMSHGGAIGRTAQRDFLAFAHGVANIDGGVYCSVGSAVMSPMIFEKSLSMAQNTARQRGAAIQDHFITVVDLQQSSWDWSQGEPPVNHPDYYLRYNKTFHRMGGAMRYLRADNRDFLLGLLHALTA